MFTRRRPRGLPRTAEELRKAVEAAADRACQRMALRKATGEALKKLEAGLRPEERKDPG